MEKIRCGWAENQFPEYTEYHDREWGVPVHDDRIHFEFLILESAQAGLSWATILKRREGYRKAFAGFDAEKVAAFDEEKIMALKNNPAIIRNELKIRAAVSNAKIFLELQKEFGSFDAYLRQYTGEKAIIGHWESEDEVPATTEVSDRLSADMKKRGFKFTGSTIMYAHLQACGLVNDHITGCFRYKELSASSG